MHATTTRVLAGMACWGSLALVLPAATPLADFEQESDLAAWRWASRGESSLTRGGRFATRGDWSLEFRSPAWRAGQPEWPAFETGPVVGDWTGYDRLVVDITNPRRECPRFALFVSDRTVPFRQGLSYRFDLPSQGFRRFVIPLDQLPPAVDRKDIAVLHFFSERPAAALELHLDQLVLLRPGETLPGPGPAFARQLAPLARAALDNARGALADCRRQAGGLAVADPVRERATARLDALAARLGELETGLAAPGLDLARLDALNLELAALPDRAARTLSVAKLHQACVAAGLPTAHMLLGIASPMEKILPRTVPFEVAAAREASLSLARNEKESIQLLVLPVAGALRGVEVSAGDLLGPGGAVLRKERIRCEVTGYVETKARPPYGTPHLGWWPDPILDFLGPVEIAEEDLQSFWVRVRAPKDQAPGLYQGSLTVAAGGIPPVSVPLRVRVRSFTLPDHSPLPLAVTFAPSDHPLDATRAAQAEWRNEPEYPVRAWQRQRLAWADFLADYYLNYDSLYRHGPPDFEIVERLHDRGQLVAFNLGIFDGLARDPATADKTLAGLREAYRKARELGVLEHAYVYGFDECREEQFPRLEECAQTLRRELPEALRMTTSYDHSYGLDTAVKTIDAWCPLTPKFDPAQAARARAAGRQVWWYICCGPHHPHANMFLEYPAIEGRLLTGAMSVKQRPDGFLYYQISIWNSRRPIVTGPFTDWDPRSWTTYHGDGSWTCVGPGGKPLPTVRLENFRDGLEDYAYALILGEAVRRVEAEGGTRGPRQSAWLAEAKAALAVPAGLVKSMTEYSRDPAVLAEWRGRLAELIDRSGLDGLNPWGENFGTRGLPAPPP